MERYRLVQYARVWYIVPVDRYTEFVAWCNTHFWKTPRLDWAPALHDGPAFITFTEPEGY